MVPVKMSKIIKKRNILSNSIDNCLTGQLQWGTDCGTVQGTIVTIGNGSPCDSIPVAINNDTTIGVIDDNNNDYPAVTTYVQCPAFPCEQDIWYILYGNIYW